MPLAHLSKAKTVRRESAMLARTNSEIQRPVHRDNDSYSPTSVPPASRIASAGRACMVPGQSQTGEASRIWLGASPRDRRRAVGSASPRPFVDLFFLKKIDPFVDLRVALQSTIDSSKWGPENTPIELCVSCVWSTGTSFAKALLAAPAQGTLGMRRT